ncbi:hypothetical protein PPTG_24634 [Phytophthora nicotianae INRA-310]|nr:hypothetical protein PPTG_24634 [Phytophthora nicotianae INRA-310]ETM98384.1 hypothetical protein PPTG_24634 [Phytophthora nicotianae INRA-310]
MLFTGEDTERDILLETSIPSNTSGFTQKIRDQILAQRMYLD